MSDCLDSRLLSASKHRPLLFLFFSSVNFRDAESRKQNHRPQERSKAYQTARNIDVNSIVFVFIVDVVCLTLF